jgi:flagellar biogenesis protein FliO
MSAAPDLTTAAIKMVGSLGVVLLIVWALYRIAKGKLPINAMGGKAKLIQIVDSQYVGVKKSIALVQIPGSILVVGVGADNVNLLTRIDDPDIINGIKAAPEKQRALNFTDQLNRFTKPRQPKRPDLHNESAETP